MAVKKYFKQLIKDRDSDITLYLCGIAIASGVLMLALFTDIVIKHTGLYILRECAFKKLTGLYCPGCGGTRAFLCILRGDIILSLRFNPFTLYFTVLTLVFYISQSIRILSCGKIKGFHPGNIWIFTGLVILVLNFTIKNIFLNL